MKEWLIGQGIIFYVFAGSLLVGLIAAFVANHGYKRLIKETELMANTENRLLKYIKLKFGSYYKLNMKPQDTRALARHYMYKYKIGFMSAASWIKLSKLAAYVIGLAALVDLLIMMRSGQAVADMVMMGATAVIGIGVLYMQNRIYNFSEKQDMLEWHLIDYLENFLRNKIESGKNLQMLASQENGIGKKASGAGYAGTAAKASSEYSGAYGENSRAAGSAYGTGAARTSTGSGYADGARAVGSGYGEGGRTGGASSYGDSARAAGSGYGENSRTGGANGYADSSRASGSAYTSAHGDNTYAATGSYGSAGRTAGNGSINAAADRNPGPAATDTRRPDKPTKGTDEAAAAKIQPPYSKPSYYDPYTNQPADQEDEIDAKIVEDILKEFLS